MGLLGNVSDVVKRVKRAAVDCYQPCCTSCEGVAWLEARTVSAHLRASPKLGSCISLSSLPFLRYAGPDDRVERGVVRIPRCEARGTH